MRRYESFDHSKGGMGIFESSAVDEAEFDLMVMEAENWLKDIQDPQLMVSSEGR